MSIPPDSPWRGCAAAFPQPVYDVSEAEMLVQLVSQHNSGFNVTYRSTGGRDSLLDVTRHVFRWDMTPYSQVFENGFAARHQGDTPNGTYFSLDHHVHDAGTPLDPNRPVTHAFISTTLSGGWRPTTSATTLPRGGQIQVYRYEIYAPGGIWVRQTLRDRYQHPRQDEVAFVRGIARQYIRSAQLYIGTHPRNRRYPSWDRANRRIIINGHFNPQSHPPRIVYIQNPVFDYYAENRTHRPPLTISIWRPELPNGSREERDASDFFPGCFASKIASDSALSDVPEGTVDWYAGGVADSPGYINAAFRSSIRNEAYLFMRNEYVLVNYAPGTMDDRIVNGPLIICDGYPSLSDTAFGEYGIDCAFDRHGGNEAFIFCGNLCAHIDYAPGTTNDRILNGPLTITDMFPFFDDTVFANSIDAAFTSSATHEAYLFKGDSYANINYYSKTLIAIRKITEGFYSLRNTIFQTGVEAAFASHQSEEAYLFKGDQYALINFARGTTGDYIIGGVKPIIPNWPSLRGILPRKNRGVDDHDHHNQEQDHQDDYGEL